MLKQYCTMLVRIQAHACKAGTVYIKHALIYIEWHAGCLIEVHVDVRRTQVWLSRHSVMLHSQQQITYYEAAMSRKCICTCLAYTDT